MSDLPSIFNRIKHLAKSVQGATEHYLETGKVLASEETISSRQEICSSCPKNINNTCSICGCFLKGNKLTPGKTEVASESCDLGKWNKESL